MGARIDGLKLVSSMTLFAAVAPRLVPADDSGESEHRADTAEAVLSAAATGYPPCALMLETLRTDQ